MKIVDTASSKKIRNFVGKLFWNLPPFILRPIISIRFKKRFINIVKLEHRNQIFRLSEPKNLSLGKPSIYFHHALRATRYFEGIEVRIRKLLEEYCVDQISDLQPGLFVDVGSNVGEFSMGIAGRFPGSSFIRFEPSAEECAASMLNMMGEDDLLISKALWKEPAVLDFYQRNQSGDSSIFSPDSQKNRITIEVSTLDIECNGVVTQVIQLLKLEAEGAEPEILLGGEKTIRKCRYVSADLGPERGTTKESTFQSADKILRGYGFELVGRNPASRECYLYKNMEIE